MKKVKMLKKYNINLLLLVVLLALGLRIFHLDFYDFFNDEIFFVSASKRATFFETPCPAHMPFAIVVLKWMQKFVGESDFILRLPSVLFSVLTVLWLFLTAKEMFNKKVGFIAAFLLAISTASIARAQEAKHYSFVAFFSILSPYFLFSMLNHGFRWGKLFLMLVSMFLTIYSGYVGLFPNLVICVFVFFLFLANFLNSKKKKSFLIKGAIFLIPIIALATIFFAKTTLPQLLTKRLSVSLVSLKDVLTKGRWKGPYNILKTFSNENLWPYFSFFLISLLFSGWQIIYSGFKKLFPCLVRKLNLKQFSNLKIEAKEIKAWLFLHLWVIAFLAFHLFLNISFISQVHLPQYYIYFEPFYLILVSQGILTLSRFVTDKKNLLMTKVLPLVFVLFLVNQAKPALWDYYFKPSVWRADWQASSRYLERNSAPKDVLVCIIQPYETVDYVSHYFDYKNYGVDYSLFPVQGRRVNWLVSLQIEFNKFVKFEDWAVSGMIHPSRRAYPTWVYRLSYLGKGKEVVKIQDRSNWQLRASSNPQDLKKTIDGDAKSQWKTGENLKRGDFFQIDLGRITTLAWLELISHLSQFYPKDYVVETSKDGISWQLVQSGFRSDDTFHYYYPIIPFEPIEARFVKITNLWKDKLPWIIYEANLYEVADRKLPEGLEIYQEENPFTGLVVKDNEAKMGYAKFLSKNESSWPLIQYGQQAILSEGSYRARFRIKTDNNQSKGRLAIHVGFEQKDMTPPQFIKIEQTDFDQVNKYQEFYLDFDHQGEAKIVFVIKNYGRFNYWLDYPEIKKIK